MIPHQNPLEPQTTYLPPVNFAPINLQHLYNQNTLLQLHLAASLIPLQETTQYEQTTHLAPSKNSTQNLFQTLQNTLKTQANHDNMGQNEQWFPLFSADSTSSGSSNEEELDRNLNTDFCGSERPVRLIRKKIQKKETRQKRSVLLQKPIQFEAQYLEDQQKKEYSLPHIPNASSSGKSVSSQPKSETKIHQSASKIIQKPVNAPPKSKKTGKQTLKEKVKLSDLLKEQSQKQLTSQLKSQNQQQQKGKPEIRPRRKREHKKPKKEGKKWSMKKYMNLELENMLCGNGISLQHVDGQTGIQKKQFFTFSWDFCWLTTFDETDYSGTVQKLRVENLNYSVNECLDELVFEYEDAEVKKNLVFSNCEDCVQVSKLIRGFQMLSQRLQLKIVGKKYKDEINQQQYYL